eukprot:sb/3462444/
MSDNMMDEIIIGEDTGVSMEAVGFLLGRDGNHYRSIFLKLQDPIDKMEICNQLCPGSVNKAVTQWTRDRQITCKVGLKRGKTFAPELRRIRHDGGIPANVCVKTCLLDPFCFQVGVTATECVLRPRELTDDEMERATTDYGEYGMKCFAEADTKQAMCEAAAKTAEETLLLELDSENRKFVQKTWDNLNSLIPTEKGINKRGVKDWLLGGGTGLSLLTAGYDLWATVKLKKHVNEIQQEFEAFKNNQTRFDKEQIKFNGKILEVSQHLEQRIERQECRSDQAVWHLLNQRRLSEWKDYMQQLYRGVLAGSQVGDISPIIFPKKYMEKLVRDDTSLAKTAYNENIALAYRLGLLAVVSHGQGEGQFAIHVVLSFPDLGTQGVKEVYRVLQTGVAFNDSQCGRFELPSVVYKEENKFYEMEEAICETKANLHLCWGGSGAGRREVSCLSNKEECKIGLEKCSTQVRENRAGLQVRTAEQVRASMIKTPDVWKRVDMGRTRTKFFNRSQYAGVIVGEYERSMAPEEHEIRVTTLPNPDQWRDIISQRWETHQRENISDLATIVHEQKQIVKGIMESGKIRGGMKLTDYLAIAATVIATLGTVGIVTYLVAKHKTAKIGEDKQQVRYTVKRKRNWNEDEIEGEVKRESKRRSITLDDESEKDETKETTQFLEDTEDNEPEAAYQTAQLDLDLTLEQIPLQVPIAQSTPRRVTQLRGQQHQPTTMNQALAIVHRKNTTR